MANIILKLFPNKWDGKHFFSLIQAEDNKKPQHFLAHNNYKKKIKADEYWECFIWDKKEKEDKILYKVIPFKKIEEQELADAKSKVKIFNKELNFLESLVGKNFPEIKFVNGNTPFLVSTLSEEEITKLYPGYMIMREDDKVIVRPSKEMFKRLVHYAKPKRTINK